VRHGSLPHCRFDGLVHVYNTDVVLRSVNQRQASTHSQVGHGCHGAPLRRQGTSQPAVCFQTPAFATSIAGGREVNGQETTARSSDSIQTIPRCRDKSNTKHNHLQVRQQTQSAPLRRQASSKCLLARQTPANVMGTTTTTITINQTRLTVNMNRDTHQLCARHSLKASAIVSLLDLL
jgi:hypothetical protein